MSKFGRIMISGIITSAILMTACGKETTNTNVNGHIEEEVEVVYPEEETANDTNSETTDVTADTAEVSDAGTEGEVELNEDTIKEMLDMSSDNGGLSDEEWDRIVEYVKANYTEEGLNAKILESFNERYDKTLNYEEYYGEFTGDDHFYDIHCEVGVTTLDEVLAQLPGSEFAEYVDYVETHATNDSGEIKLDELNMDIISEQFDNGDHYSLYFVADAGNPFLGYGLESRDIIILESERNNNGDYIITEIKHTDVSDLKEELEELAESDAKYVLNEL